MQRRNNDKADRTNNRDIHTQTAKESRGLTPSRPCSLWSVPVRCWPVVNPVNHQALPLHHFSPFSSAYLFLYRPLPLCCQGDLCTLVLTRCGKEDGRRRKAGERTRGVGLIQTSAFQHVNNRRPKKHNQHLLCCRINRNSALSESVNSVNNGLLIVESTPTMIKTINLEGWGVK